MDLGSLTSGMTAGNLIGNIIFSGIGFVAFMYGKKQGQFQRMALGGALMVYPYFVTNTALMFLIGAALTVTVWYARD
jgi:hypothetical protein